MNWLRTILQQHRERLTEWRPYEPWTHERLTDINGRSLSDRRVVMRRKLNGEWQFRAMTETEAAHERREDEAANAW